MASTTRQLFKVLIGGLLLAVTSACSPLKMLNALTPDGTFDKTEGIAYGSDPRQKLDVYVPRRTVENAPVVVFFYGGSWNSGSRSDYSFVGEALASRGIVAVLADYRLYPQVRYPSFLEDGAKAVAWTHEHIRQFSGDPKRLYLMGHSSGAYNVAMLALEPQLLGAVACRHMISAAGSAWPGRMTSCRSRIRRCARCFSGRTHRHNPSQSITSVAAHRQPC